MSLRVQFDREIDSFRATIAASGRKSGVQTLGVVGSSCEPLSEAVAVTLAILMDREIKENASQPTSTPKTDGGSDDGSVEPLDRELTQAQRIASLPMLTRSMEDPRMAVQ